MTAPDTPPPAEAPATIEMVCVAGPRHGQMVTVPPDAKSWVDLMSAQTYYRQPMKFIAHDPRNPMSVSLRKGWFAEVLIHESVVNTPDAMQWFSALALLRLYEVIGREVPIEQIINRPPDSPNGRAGGN